MRPFYDFVIFTVYALLCVLSCDWCTWSMDTTEITQIGNPKFEDSFQINYRPYFSLVYSNTH